MKPTFLLLTTAFTINLMAQDDPRVFSVTDQVKGGYNWSAIRLLSPNNDQQLILNNQAAKGTVIDAGLLQKKGDYAPNTANFNDQPMYSGVAALAYDKQNERLFFATMFSQQLRYINLRESPDRYYQVASLAGPSKSAIIPSPQQQGPVITRMTIAPDGYGYGISNDGQAFFRFSLKNPNKVEFLGGLVDDSKNGSLSVHNACSGWGGDIVAAANNDLYLFTMKQLVFKIDPSSRVASFLGKITGLDSNFTVNGAAVDEKGRVILSTATFAGSRGIIENINNLVATVEKSETIYNASDLASCYYLFGKTNHNQNKPQKLVFNSKKANRVALYPNPANNGFTQLQFDKKVSGQLTIDVLTGAGKTVIRKPVQVKSDGQLIQVNTNTLAKGLYMIRVTDASSKEVYYNKLVVQ